MRRCDEKKAWAERLGVPWTTARVWSNFLLIQLCQCKSDEARRLLLGVK